MNHSWAKNRVTSRRVGPRRYVTESFTKRRRDVGGNVATLEATSRRDSEWIYPTSRLDIPRRDVTEALKNDVAT